MVALISYTVTPCPSCGDNMTGSGSVTRNGSDLWTGLIACDHCGYAVSGEGSGEFYAASATADKHRQAVKRSGWRMLDAAHHD